MAKSKSTRSKVPAAGVHEARQIVAFAVSFRRSLRGKWEDGLFVGQHDTDDRGLIFDMDGRVVPAPVWEYFDRHYRGSLIVREEP